MTVADARRDKRIVEVVQCYSQQLWAYIRARVRSDDDAADIQQEVWLQLTRMTDLDLIERISAWLYTVAGNRIVDYHRKKRAHSASELDIGDDDADEPVEASLFVELKTPEDEMERRRFWDELSGALAELPEPQRQAFIWNEIEGRTFREIAEVSGENIKTLISRKRYAVNLLRKRLESFRGDQ